MNFSTWLALLKWVSLWMPQTRLRFYNYTYEWFLPACASPKKVTRIKVMLLGIATAVACCGVLAHLILVFLFARKPKRETILAFLASYDCFLCLSYIALFGNEALGNYFQIKLAYDALFEYTSIMYVLTKVVQLCIPLMLIASSMQKWAFWLTGNLELGGKYLCRFG